MNTTTKNFTSLYRVIKFNPKRLNFDDLLAQVKGKDLLTIALITLLVAISQSSRPYFSMVKIRLGLVTISCATASSRLKT